MPAKITKKQRQEILTLYESGLYLNSEIGKRYGLKSVSIKNVVDAARRDRANGVVSGDDGD